MDAVEEPEFGRNDGNDAENCAVLNEWRDGEATNRGAVSDLEAIANKPTGGDLDARVDTGCDRDLLGDIDCDNATGGDHDRADAVGPDVGIEAHIGDCIVLIRIHEQQRHRLALSEQSGGTIGGKKCRAGGGGTRRPVGAAQTIEGLLDHDVGIVALDDCSQPGRFRCELGQVDSNARRSGNDDLGSLPIGRIGLHQLHVDRGIVKAGVDHLKTDGGGPDRTRPARAEPCTGARVGQ